MKKIDIYNYIKKYEKKKKNWLLLYSFLSLCFVTVSLLILFISKREYLVYLLINILLSCSFGFFSVYFFTIILKDIKETLVDLKKVDNAISESIYAIFDSEKIEETKGKTIYLYNFHKEDGEECCFYSLEKIVLAPTKYLIESKLKYLIFIEVYKDE